jgi:hypothetical protein
MKDRIKKWGLLALGLAIIAAGYMWLDTTPTAPVNSSTSYASTSVPAPGRGQKKVVLKNLGMT